MRVIGVDFSGAAAAGEKTWVATGEASTGTDGTLRLDACAPLAERVGTADRDPCLRALVDLLREGDVAGLDVSFGLPRAVHDRDAWTDLVEWVGGAFADADDLSGTCAERTREATGGDRTYLKRATDEHRGATSPYHWLVAHQTFHGLRDVLAPLVAGGGVAVAPMDVGTDAGCAGRLPPERPVVCETYPAATLRRLGLPDTRYKDDAKHSGAPERRERTVEGLATGTPLSLAPDVRDRALADSGGDALDACLAALAAHRAWRDGFATTGEWHPVEGHIYA